VRIIISVLYSIIVLTIVLGCSGSKILTVDNVKEKQAVKISFIDGSSDVGMVIQKSEEDISYISETDNKIYTRAMLDIRRIEKSDKTYDNFGYPISEAEIDKFKTSQSTWGYAIGGAVVGGVTGLIVGLPFWYAEIGNVPPYFTAGAGAVIGSIYFAIKGQEKDRNFAIEKIRKTRESEINLDNQLEEEKQRLEKIEIEKKQLEKKIREKDNKD
jgi:hypothetical protein